MSKMVEMRLATHKQGGSERFSCNLEFWNLMVELGEAFGWKSLGATYVATPIRHLRGPEARKRDYEPGAWRDAKLVAEQDALDWASALRSARASPHLNNLTKSRRGSLDQPNCDVDIRGDDLDRAFEGAMDEFIRYLCKGAFSFATGGADDSALRSARK